MWLDLVQQGLYVNLDDVNMGIIPNHIDPDNSENDTYQLYILCETSDHITFTREQRDMFVALHKEAMDNGENVFSFDQDRPKFKMKLSGDEDEMDADVGLE